MKIKMYEVSVRNECRKLSERIRNVEDNLDRLQDQQSEYAQQHGNLLKLLYATLEIWESAGAEIANARIDEVTA